MDTCSEQPNSFWGKETSVFLQVYVEPGLHNVEVVPAGETAAFEAVLSSSPSGRRVLLAEAVAAGSKRQRCFESSPQRGPEEVADAVEERLEEQRHPTVVQVERPRHSGRPVGEHLVGLGHCAG